MKKELIKSVLAAGFAAAILTPASLTFAAPYGAVNLAKSDSADEPLPHVVKDAKKMEESSDQASFHVPEKGQVWLYDVNDKEVVHSISVNKGFLYAFDTRKSKVYVNSKEGAKVELTPKHTYRIYYVTAAERDRSGKPADEYASLPDTAKRVAEAKGKNLEYKSDEEGTAYLWNSTDNELANTFHLLKDQVIKIEPDANRVVVEDKVILKDADLSPKKTYKLFFDVKTTK